MKRKKTKTKKGTTKRNTNIKFLDKNGNVDFSKISFPSYEQTIEKINSKLGKLPKRPNSLSKGKWTKQAKKVLKERYLFKYQDGDGVIQETPDEMCWRVAWRIASAESLWGKTKKQVNEIAKQFYNILDSRNFLPNSPTLMNAGTGNGMQYSGCYVLPIEDSMEGIFDGIKYQAIIHKSGGGTGFSFSRLRPRGSVVKTSSGVASGPVSFMKIYDAATNEVKQGGKRRGANMGILRVDHPDIREFIACKKDGGITNFNISVAITDKFMEALKKGDDYELINPKTKQVSGTLNAEDVFSEIVRLAWETGDPGLIFLDRINKGKANPIPKLGPIESTNPCVTGSTLVSTNKGLVSIKELHGKKMNFKVLVDGRMGDSHFNQVVKVVKTGKKKVFRMITKEGYEVCLTKEHKIKTKRGWIKAENLIENDEIFIANRKGLFGKGASLEEGRILGWLVGDGTMKVAEAVLSFFGSEKQELAPKFALMVADLVDGRQLINRSYPVGVRMIKGRDEARVQSTRLWRYAKENGISQHDKLKVPRRVLRGCEQAQRGFLQALFTADGHVAGLPEKGVSVRLTSINLNLLKDIQRLLLNFGIASKIYCDRREEEKRYLPDGKGGYKKYLCSAYHDLVISRSNLITFVKEIGFLAENKNVKLIEGLKKYTKGPYTEKFLVRFDHLEYEGIEEVYDLKEPITSSFVANGVVVHNCGEQPLYPYDACNLGSIFLTYFVKEENNKIEVDWERLKEVTSLAVRFLDNVIEVNPYPLEQIRKTVLSTRRIGLGIGGWADMLAKLNIPYDSEEAIKLAEKVMKTIQNEASKETERLAGERGAFPFWPLSIYKTKNKRRNSTITTIAPTGSISIIAGSSSGIEPFFAIAFQHIVKDRGLNRELVFVNPIFKKVVKERGIFDENVEKQIAEKGVIRSIDEIPEDIRKVFGTAQEIDYKWHVRMQSVFQKYTENAVSKTINLPKSATTEDVRNAYLFAWETGCNGITIFRDGSKDIQVLNLGTQKKDEKVEEEAKTWARPLRVIGSTFKIKTPVGTAFITVNQDERGDPVEVFINVGRAGSDVQAMAEALGRLISKSLKMGSSLSTKERALIIVDQLKGIGGRRSVGFGPNKILSLPDAIAFALSTYLGVRSNGFNYVSNGVEKEHKTTNGEAKKIEQEQTLDLQPDNKTDVSIEANPQKGEIFVSESFQEINQIGDICPSCGIGAFVYQEGCSKCFACGHSEC